MPGSRPTDWVAVSSHGKSWRGGWLDQRVVNGACCGEPPSKFIRARERYVKWNRDKDRDEGCGAARVCQEAMVGLPERRESTAMDNAGSEPFRASGLMLCSLLTLFERSSVITGL